MTHLINEYIIAVGDTHSLKIVLQIVKSATDDLPLIFLGDIGIGFNPQDDIKYIHNIDKAAKQRNRKVFLLRGNHDDPAYWERDFDVDNVVFVKDYDIIKFKSGRKALCVGGGLSVDRCRRVEGKSYWSGELTEYVEDKCEPCEILFLHDAPSYFGKGDYSLKYEYPEFVREDKQLLSDSKRQRETIDKIVDKCKPIRIYGGHYHEHMMMTRDHMIYYCLDINEQKILFF